MNIGIFSDSYLPHRNGVAYSIYRQSQKLIQEGHYVSIISPSHLDSDIKISTREIFRTKDIRYSLYIPTTKYFRILEKLNLDLIHLHTPFSFGIMGALYAKKHNIPVIYTHHTNFKHYYHYIPLLNNWLGVKLWVFFYKQFLRSADTITTPSNHARLLLSRKFDLKLKDIHVIPTPVFFLQRNESVEVGRDKNFDLVIVGRISHEKNINITEKVIIDVLKEFKDVKIAIIGDGIEKNNFISRMEKYIDKNIFVLGELEYKIVRDVIKNSRFLFSSSISETQGLVIQDAWAEGVPVIGISCEVTREFVSEGRNGWLSDNSPESLSMLTCSLLRSNLESNAEVVASCHDSAKEFCPNRWYHNYLNIVEETL